MLEIESFCCFCLANTRICRLLSAYFFPFVSRTIEVFIFIVKRPPLLKHFFFHYHIREAFSIRINKTNTFLRIHIVHFIFPVSGEQIFAWRGFFHPFFVRHHLWFDGIMHGTFPGRLLGHTATAVFVEKRPDNDCVTKRIRLLHFGCWWKGLSFVDTSVQTRAWKCGQISFPWSFLIWCLSFLVQVKMSAHGGYGFLYGSGNLFDETSARNHFDTRRRERTYKTQIHTDGTAKAHPD